MPRRLYKVLLLVVVALTLPALASLAAPFTPELEADYAAALAWWSVPAPPQCASVRREVLAMEDPYGEGVAGRATQPLPGETDIDCDIALFEPALALQFPTACEKEAVLRHEVGHLLGYGHDTDPHSIMSAQGLRYSCPDRVDDLRWRHLFQWERCYSLPQYATKRQREHCWAKSRRTLAAVLTAIRQQA